MKTNARVVKVIAKFLFLSQSQIIGLFWLSQPRWSIFPVCILQNVGEKKLWMYLLWSCGPDLARAGGGTAGDRGPSCDGGGRRQRESVSQVIRGDQAPSVLPGCEL